MRIRAAALVLGMLAASAGPALAAPVAALRVLVTNDDGVAAPGIDALVQALTANPNLQVTVIAPATNQSGTGDQVTGGTISVAPSSTAGAFPATAVAARPADSVLFALLQALPQPPDLVVSGINAGQNAGEISTLSGTVGAALTAARLGIPAIAASHGITYTTAAQYAESAQYVADLVERFRVSRGFRAKMTTRSRARFALVLNVNFPSCASRGVVLVPLGRVTRYTGYTPAGPQMWTLTTSSTNPFVCTSTLNDPATDVDGLTNGFATLTPLNPDLTVSQKIKSFRFLMH